MLDPVLMEQLQAGGADARVEAFLEECARASAQNVREAAALAKARKYRKWQPL